MDPTRLFIASIAAALTETTMAGVTPCVMDPTLKDHSINDRITMQMQVFTAWWDWLVTALNNIDGGGGLYAPTPLNIAPIISQTLGANGFAAATALLTKFLGSGKPAAAVTAAMSPVLQSILTPPPPAPTPVTPATTVKQP